MTDVIDGDIVYKPYLLRHNSFQRSWFIFELDSERCRGVESSRKKIEPRLARIIVEDEQDILAPAYQDKMHAKGEQYSYMDALDAVIHEATHNARHFLDVLLPELRAIDQASGRVSLEISFD